MSGLALKVSGNALRIDAVKGRLAVCERFAIEAACVVGVAPVLDDFIGAPFELTFDTTAGDAFAIAGIVVAVEHRPDANVTEADEHRLTLFLGPTVDALAVGQNDRVFRNVDAKAAVTTVLTDAGIAADTVTWQLGAALAVREHFVQRDESDWAFIERILAEEGIYWAFDATADGTKLVFADDSTSAPAIDGKSLVYVGHKGTIEAGDWVRDVTTSARVVTGAVSLADYAFARPATKLTGAKGAGAHAAYTYPGRVADGGAAQARAARDLEAHAAASSIVTGAASTLRLRPGQRFDLEDHVVEALSTNYFCTAIELASTEARRGGAGGMVVAVRWSAIASSVPFRPEIRPRFRPAAGLTRGFVAGKDGAEIDLVADGRVVVRPTWQREPKSDDSASPRVRVAQIELVDAIAFPREGWEALLAFHDDDQDRPFVLGWVHDGARMPPYPLPDNKTRSVLSTRESPGGAGVSEVRIEDAKGAEEIWVHASKDMSVTIGDTRAITIGHDRSATVKGDRTFEAKADRKVGIGKDHTEKVDGNDTLTIDGSRSITVKGAENRVVKGDDDAKTDGDEVTDVQGASKLSVGGDAKTETTGTLARTVLGDDTIDVTGDVTVKSKKGRAITVAGAAVEKVGASLTVDAQAVTTTVKGDYASTVSAATTMTVSGDSAEGATGKLGVKTKGALAATSAAKIEIEADSELTISCGSSKIVMKPGGIEVSSSMITVSGGLLVVSGGKAKLNP